MEPRSARMERNRQLWRCERCYLHRRLCLCASLPRVPVTTRFLVVRHFLEAFKVSNTGRLAPLALDGCRLVDYAREGEPLDETPLREPGTWLLYPDRAGLPAPGEIVRQVIVLDGSWPQTRRMAQRIRGLAGLPRLALPAPVVAPTRLRRQKLAEGMSTLEAIARAVEVLEGAAMARPIDDLYATFVARTLEACGVR